MCHRHFRKCLWNRVLRTYFSDLQIFSFKYLKKTSAGRLWEEKKDSMPPSAVFSLASFVMPCCHSWGHSMVLRGFCWVRGKWLPFTDVLIYISALLHRWFPSLFFVSVCVCVCVYDLYRMKNVVKLWEFSGTDAFREWELLCIV